MYTLAYHHQKYNKEHEVESLLAFNNEMAPDHIVMYHGDVPSDIWVLGTAQMTEDLKNLSTGLPIIDPTFNHGHFEVMPFTYRHQLFESYYTKEENMYQL